MKSHKTVASLSWLFFAASLPPSSPGPSSAGGGGGLPSPTEQLLHFPIPPGPCKGFSAHVSIRCFSVSVCPRDDFNESKLIREHHVENHPHKLHGGSKRVLKAAHRGAGRGFYAEHERGEHSRCCCFVSLPGGIPTLVFFSDANTALGASKRPRPFPGPFPL